MAGVDTFADLLYATVASAGNDHRLGAHEAPPPIISIFLGEQLSDIVSQLINNGGAKSSKRGGTIQVGVSTIPPLPCDATDRNRTSPFAFTANKFEFRAVGSNQSCAGPNVAINAAATWGIDQLCTLLEAELAAGVTFNEALAKVLKHLFKKHQRVLFDGDNYSDAWRTEACRRGLPCALSTPEALEALRSRPTLEMFQQYSIFTERELLSRFDIYSESYRKTIMIEAACALRIVRTQLIPAGLAWARELATSGDEAPLARLTKRVRKLTLQLLTLAEKIEQTIAKENPAASLTIMDQMRTAADELETLTPAHLWPLPTYAEMLFFD